MSSDKENNNQSIVEAFIQNFYGYGNLAGKYWFIGMEEGGGRNLIEIEDRLDVWNGLGRPETADLAEFHLRLGMPQFFRDPVKLQYTWGQLIRIILSMQGITRELENVMSYQKDFLGRQAGETCLLEILPLPSPNTRTWHYGNWYMIPYLQSREIYRQNCIPWRAAHLRELIHQYRPEVVVFYGLVYRPWFEAIIGQQFLKERDGAIESAVRSDTLFVLVRHPAARGVGKTYFKHAGNQVRELLKGKARNI